MCKYPYTMDRFLWKYTVAYGGVDTIIAIWPTLVGVHTEDSFSSFKPSLPVKTKQHTVVKGQIK